ncbi:MAG: nucleoside 2-deoxyribosyltransferase domain-containing protein [Methanosarcinaceae archaeon]|nr:nucleoside 2-deoxyribosyltransferase domain-containing protein [Methanosarcinaceae archaeon]
MSRETKIYLAAPLFSQAERTFNASLHQLLDNRGFVVYLPQEDSEDNSSKRDDLDQQRLFENNRDAIDECDIIVAVLDGGSDVDSGTAWEIGYAYAKGKTLLTLKTDFRTLGSEGIVNLMIECSVNELETDVGSLLDSLEKYR